MGDFTIEIDQRALVLSRNETKGIIGGFIRVRGSDIQ